MSREVPVRFREGLGVQFPRATRLEKTVEFLGRWPLAHKLA